MLDDKQELIDIIETIYKGAKKGRGLVVSPKGKSACFWFYALSLGLVLTTFPLQITLPDTDTRIFILPHCFPYTVRSWSELM